MSTQAKIEKMLKKSEVILAAGGEKRVTKQHEAGKMTARERIAALLDEGSFVELDRFVNIVAQISAKRRKNFLAKV